MYEIHNEKELFEAIKRVENGELTDFGTIRFVGFPRREIIIEGESFGGGIPTRVMPAFLALQKAIDAAYSRSVHGEDRRLSKEEKKHTELIVLVQPGSTTFVSELMKPLNTLVQIAAQNMSGPETITIILGVAAIAASGYIWKAHINQSAERYKLDLENRARLSEEETKRLQITQETERRTRLNELDTQRFQAIENLALQHSQLAIHLADERKSQVVLLKQLDERDELYVKGEAVVTGEVAKHLVRKTRSPQIEDRLDGVFVIQSVDSGRVRNGFKVHTRNAETDEELSVFIPEDTLEAEQISNLQHGEWGKSPVRMQINIVRSGDRIIRATLIRAGLSSSEN